LSADVAMRKYLITSYPNLNPQAMQQASKWFLSELALARYAAFLEIKDVIKFEPSEVTYYDIPKPERVTMLSSTLKCLYGAVYETEGMEGVDKVVAQHISWVEGLNITEGIDEEEQPQSTPHKARLMSTIPLGSLPQPKSGPGPNWLAHALKSTSPSLPTATLAEFFAKNNLGEPRYRVLQEVGRHTSEPLFYIGVYGNDAQLVGTGLSSSHIEAQLLAAANALTSLYSTKATKV